MNYTDYRVEDFVLDPCFRDWVLNRSNPLYIFWTLWMEDHPERFRDIEEARKILFILNPVHPIKIDKAVEFRWKEICN